MFVSSTEFKTNLGRYLDLVTSEDIIITRNGRKIAKLVKEEEDAFSDVRSLYGILSGTELSAMEDSEIKDVIHMERSRRYGEQRND
jgi:prevent-host-death family protein